MGRLMHTVNGDVASFRAASRVPLESLKFHFLPKQASETPSPENPIPIEGWMGLNGFVANENLISLQDLTFVNQSVDINTVVDGSDIRLTAIKNTNTWAGASQDASYDVPSALRGKEIFFSIDDVTLETVNKADQRSTIVCEFRDANNAFITDPTVLSYQIGLSTNTMGRKITVPSNAAVMKLFFRMAQNIRDYGVLIGDYIIFHNFCIKYQDNKLGFKDHEGVKIPITFPVSGKNLVNDEATTRRGWSERNGHSYSNTKIDTRGYVALSVQQIDKDDNIMQTLSKTISSVGRDSITFTALSGCDRIMFKHNGKIADIGIYIPWDGRLGTYTISANFESLDIATIGGFVFSDVQIELGNVMTSYEVYSSDNTFYGGYVDPVAGEIVAEYELLEGLWGDWPNLSDQGDGTELRYKRFTNPVYGNGISNHHTDYCNVAKYSYTNANGEPHYYIVANSYNCRMYLPSGYDTTQNIQVIGKLITPIHIPTPAEDIKAFLDHNNFWSDANGMTEVTYPVTESRDILATRKKAIAFDQGKRRKVRWNQWMKPLTSEYWSGYSAEDVSVAFDDEISTSTWLSDKIGYMTSVKSNNTVSPRQTVDEIWYASYMLNPSKSGLSWGIEMCGGVQLTCTFNTPSGEWTHVSAIAMAQRTNRAILYITNLKTTKGSDVGMTAKAKAPIHINLTQMFGAGNEPTTVFEFERICAINGIDLTTYQPYDEGSDRWLIIP